MVNRLHRLRARGRAHQFAHRAALMQKGQCIHTVSPYQSQKNCQYVLSAPYRPTAWPGVKARGAARRARSEERRVGKEWRWGWERGREKQRKGAEREGE